MACELYHFQACICHCNLYPLHAANCCRNSRRVVKYHLKWVQMKKILLLKQFHTKKSVLKPLGLRRTISHSSEMQNDALMYREGLEGFIV